MQNQVVFTYDGQKLAVQCKENEKMRDIINTFASKSGIDNNKLKTLFFVYSGKGGVEFDQNLTFKEMANETDKRLKIMNILVNENNEATNNCTLIKSKEIICPKCGKICKIIFQNYKINLFDCENQHITSNISLKDFPNTQNIDASKIICEKCKERSLNNVHKNEFYKCFECNMNLCPLCKDIHDEDHNIIEYNKINYYCREHIDFYSKYCTKCKKNICVSCEKEHSEHRNIYFGIIIFKKQELNSKLDEIEKHISKIKNDFENIKSSSHILFDIIINEIIVNFDSYYKIKKDIFSNFKPQDKNYTLLINLKEISNSDDIINDINKITNEKTLIINLLIY